MQCSNDMHISPSPKDTKFMLDDSQLSSVAVNFGQFWIHMIWNGHNMLHTDHITLISHPTSISIRIQTIAEFASIFACVNKWNYCLLRRQYIINVRHSSPFITSRNMFFFHMIPEWRRQKGIKVLVAHTIVPFHIHMVCVCLISSSPSSSYAIIARFMKQNNGKRNQLNRWSIDLRWIYGCITCVCVRVREWVTEHRSHQTWSDCNRCHYNHR